MSLSSISLSDSIHYTDDLPRVDEDLLKALLKESLLSPLKDFYSVPGKNFRSLLVEIGYRSAGKKELSPGRKDQQRITTAASIIQAIHNGALIVDDIQDGSVTRRQEPTLHLKYGLARALNAGNWLYFWALEQIKFLDLDHRAHSVLMENSFRLLSRAHLGQALDVGTSIASIPKRRIHSLCLASMGLKTGTLMSLALIMGGVIGGASKKRLKQLERMGARLGLILQMFDDLGNLFEERGGKAKQFEDLSLQRPTWVWALASLLSPKVFEEFKKAILLLPDSSVLEAWIADNNFREFCFQETHPYLLSVMNECQADYQETHPKTFDLIKTLTQRLEQSYVNKAH